ncbi:hypothetical protein SLE2022_235880 [Rubroshorea leprosula]
MEDTIILYPVLLTILPLLLLALKFIPRTTHKNLPPSPPSLPIIGHLHLIKRPAHHTFFKLAQKYSPIFSLKFGSRLVVVVSSSSVAEECFTKNDIVLANRPKFLAGKHLGYNYSTLVSSPYGDHRRNLRRISAIEIFSPDSLNIFLQARNDEIRLLLTKLSSGSHQDFAKVELKSAFTNLTFNIIMRMIVGKRYYGEDVGTDGQEAEKVRELIADAFKICEAMNPGEFLPLSNLLNRKFVKMVKNISMRMDSFLQGLVDEHRIIEWENTDTLIHHLLSLQESQPEYYTDQMIKGFMLVMILAGTDTSAATLEWAMSSLLNHPEVLRKVRDELDAQIRREHLIDDSDLSKLPNLQNLISESLRLDPEFWDEPMSFKPERFESRGEVHKLMPFGLGRRACPGADLAYKIVGLTLGSLIQCFEWKRINEKEIDMMEGSGLTMHKAQPLVALCKARLIINKVLHQY